MTAAGVVTVATGTFLPWLRSGVVLRNSYQAAEALRPLVRGLPAAALTAWPAVLPLCGLCVAAYALGLSRTTAGTAALLAAATAATAAFVLSTEPSSLIAAVRTGPITTLAGAALLLAGATAILAANRNPPAEQRQ